jgi:dCMP deaminase
MMVAKSCDWDRYFITMAYLVSMKSKDPSTRVGAVIVGEGHEIRSTGFNGFPRGVRDLQERYENRDYKYYACNHAEENAILHCARIGVSAMGCTLYTQWLPCSYCAKAIIQSGISTVVYHKEFPGNSNSTRWQNSMNISNEMMLEAGIAIRVFSGKILQIDGLYNNNIFSP